jgi:hypothetical protein
MGKNTFEKKRSLSGSAGSPEFRVDPTGQTVFFKPITGPSHANVQMIDLD